MLRFRRSASVAFRQLGDECLLVPIRTRADEQMAVFRLNEVGAFLWQALCKPVTEETLVKKLSKEFEVGPERARKDLAGFIELLTSRQLIERVEK